MAKMDTFLVLGSEGLIGTHLCAFLGQQGHKVLRFDIQNDVQQDLRLAGNALLEQYLQECDFVFFLAFDVGGYKYLSTRQYGYDFIHNNIRLQGNTFEQLKKYGKKFIFTSTQMSAIRYLPYGTLKIVGEHYTQALGALYVRLWNVYGKEEDNEKAHVITDFIRMAKTEGKITMMTDGSEERQFLYVEDCVKCLYTLYTQYDTIPRTIPLHITSFEWVSIRSIADMIGNIFNGIPIIPGQYINNVQIHNKTEPDTTILQYWKPAISLKQGIEELIKLFNL